MKREEKIKKRKLRALRRRKKKALELKEIHRIMYLCNIPFRAARSYVRHGYYVSWPDNNSHTGHSQVCNFGGICAYPCDGSC